MQRSLDEVRDELRAARHEIETSRLASEETMQRHASAVAQTVAVAVGDIRSSAATAAEQATASNDAAQRIAEQLYGRGVLIVPPPKTDPYVPGSGNVMIPLDPTFQCELRITSPLHPDIYTARMLLPREYARVDDNLRELPNNIKYIALHIDSRKAPHNLIKALLALHENYYRTLWLVQRDPATLDSNLANRVSREWQCVETMHRPGDSETKGPFPHDYIFYFDQLPKEHATPYNTDNEFPLPDYEAATSGNSDEPPVEYPFEGEE